MAARAEDGFLVLSVEDDGRGISIADRCRLFQPYFTTKAHGTGLGLFVSRQILEDFAGTLGFHLPRARPRFRLRGPAPDRRPQRQRSACHPVNPTPQPRRIEPPVASYIGALGTADHETM